MRSISNSTMAGDFASTKPTPTKNLRTHREIDDHVHGIVEADRDLDVGDRLAVDEIGQAVLLPQHTVIVKRGRAVGQGEVEATGLDAAGRRNPPMCRHHEVARPLPAALQHVDLGRPAAVIGEHPERRPDAVSHRQFCADFEISVLLRELALAGQDARDVLVVEQHRLQFGRGAAWRRSRVRHRAP